MTPPTLPGGRGALDVEVGAAAMRCAGTYCGCGAEASGNGAAIWRGGGCTLRPGSGCFTGATTTCCGRGAGARAATAGADGATATGGLVGASGTNGRGS